MVEYRSDMADERSPFVRNAWYVACPSGDLTDDSLTARCITGIGLALYRDRESGAAVALRDRCPHRAFPLSKSTLRDGEIVCGYHGFRFGSDGRCTHIPSQANVPSTVRVRAFPVREDDGFVWVWTGDGDLAESAPLPTAWAPEPGADWGVARGAMEMSASYVHLHENLLDLSHLSYLHGENFAGPDYAETPCVFEETDEVIRSTRIVSPTTLPPIFANPLKMMGKDASRRVISTFVSPGLSLTETQMRRLDLGDDAPDHRIIVQHLVTPVTNIFVRYHFKIAVSFAHGALLETMAGQVRTIFGQDKDGLEALTAVRLHDADPAPLEVSVRADRAGVMLRRKLAQMAAGEQGRGRDETVAGEGARAVLDTMHT